jgi:hypothetical protein
MTDFLSLSGLARGLYELLCTLGWRFASANCTVRLASRVAAGQAGPASPEGAR